MPKKITRNISSERDKIQLISYLEAKNDYPFHVDVKVGELKRTDKQNRLMYQWFTDAAQQGDMDASDCRAYCKLHFGVPILRIHNEEFRKQYDENVRPLPYEVKTALMLPPIELPITSLMSVEQLSHMLNQIWDHYTGLGYKLTDPSTMGLEDCMKRGGDL